MHGPRLLDSAVMVLLAALTGCTAGAGLRASGPTAPPSPVVPADCPASPPGAHVTSDVPHTGDLVATSPAPLALTLCIYRPHVAPYENGRPVISWSPPSTEVQRDSSLQETVARLNALRPPPPDGPPRACTLVLGPQYRLLLAYAEGATEELAVDVNCAFVANSHGVVRDGIPQLIAELDPA